MLSFAQMEAQRGGCCKPPALSSQLRVCNTFGLRKWKNGKVMGFATTIPQRASALQSK